MYPSPHYKVPLASNTRGPNEGGTNWKMKGGQKKKKTKKSRSEKKESPSVERDADQLSIQYIRREINNNRGKLMTLATQQQGCRHLQLAIEQDGMCMVEMLYEELGDHMATLMSDPFGNYLFQELVEMSSDEQLFQLVSIYCSSSS